MHQQLSYKPVQFPEIQGQICWGFWGNSFLLFQENFQQWLSFFFFFLLLFLRIDSCMDVTFGKEVIMLISLWEWIQHVDECWVNDSRGNGVKEIGLSSSKRVHFFWYPAMGVHIFCYCLSQFQLHAAKGFQWGMFCHVFFGRISISSCSPITTVLSWVHI